LLADALALVKVPVVMKLALLRNAFEIALLNVELLVGRGSLVKALTLFGLWVPESWVARFGNCA